MPSLSQIIPRNLNLLAETRALVQAINRNFHLLNLPSGSADITGAAATTATVTFDAVQPDALYHVTFGQYPTGGAPGFKDIRVQATTQATTGFTIEISSAPGAGATLRVYWHIWR